MSREEIVASYRDALDKQAQIRILADLNVCKVADIQQLLIEAGVSEADVQLRRRGGRPPKSPAGAPPETPRSRMTEIIGALREEHARLQSICDDLAGRISALQAELAVVDGRRKAIDTALEALSAAPEEVHHE